MGEEEKELIEFIMSMIKKRMSADRVIEELVGALDEEAEIFVLKMWRMVIYESEAKFLGLS